MKKLIGKLRQQMRRLRYVRKITDSDRSRAYSNHWKAMQTARLSSFDIFDQVVDRLTNWQRSQWAKAGYQGLSQPTRRDAAKVVPFTELKKEAAGAG